jgi:signal transduction histidine kinase
MWSKIRIPFILTISFLLLAFFKESVLPDIHYGAKDVRKLEKKIVKKEKLVESLFFNIENLEPSEIFNAEVAVSSNMFAEKGIAIFIYVDNNLVYWSNNTIPVKKKYQHNNFNERFISIGNASYVSKTRKIGRLQMVGLILIKKNYPYENEFLQNGFQKDFRVPDQAKVSSTPHEYYYRVFNNENEYLFSVNFTGVKKYQALCTYLPAILYFLGIIGILYIGITLIGRIKSIKKRNLLIGLLFVILAGSKWLMVYWQFPRAFYALDLFSPMHFAASELLPTLGDLFLLTIFFLIFTYTFYRHFQISDRYTNRPLVMKIFAAVYLLFTIGTFLFIQQLFRNLIYHSSLTLETYKVLDLSVYSFIGLLIIGLNFLSFVLLVIKYFQVFKSISRNIQLLAFLLLSWFFVYLMAWQQGMQIHAASIIYFFVTVFITSRIKRKHPAITSYSQSVLLIFVTSIFAVFFIHNLTRDKELRAKQVMAVSLATEHDPVAELLLEEVDPQLRDDNMMRDYVLDSNLVVEEIFNYLKKNYFSGYWTKYDLQITICSSTDYVFVENVDEWLPCYPFFENMIEESGELLNGTNFYFLDNLNGRISYVGKMQYFNRDSSRQMSLFMELDSRRLTTELGYPELLLDEEVSGNTILNDYSYAKYNDGKLITQSGTFPYSLRSYTYGEFTDEFTISSFENYDHVIYTVNEDNIIIISTPATTIFNVLVSFSYIFVFFYLLVSIILLFINMPFLKRRFESNFKNKIQFSIISILLLSLIFIGGGTIFFSISQYKQKHYDILSEKIQSVYIELDHKLRFEEQLTSRWFSDQYDNLNQLLIKFSDVFYSDINLYNPLGNLLATSRPEIYDKDLISERMNMMAYKELAINMKAEYVHTERIGQLSYLSAYVPFMNKDGNLLAYLNLPYFTKQNVLKAEVSNLIVAVINIYVLLILLTIAVAVIISGQITRPLRLLQSKFGTIKLGREPEHINYKGKDEIGSLVKDYNRMIDELARSVELLAKSERESAWREMAKQIAHEIKNPLTPMKLSVQHLMRTYQDRKENMDEYLKHFSKTIISQIDNLSYIATAFSNFAKMPTATFKKVNVVDILADSEKLLEHHEHIKFEITNHNISEAFVYADREQLSRAFLNIMKNAMQSIPENRIGVVRVDLSKTNDLITIKISDNGHGIPEEIREHLFRPNFTTKPSGMGLGLAITKNIIENAGGTINYETEMGKGTTFIIELPSLK